MSDLPNAIVIAAQTYGTTIGKDGKPSILHPLRVMMEMLDDDRRIVAVLHDLLEDWPGWTGELLRQRGFAPHIVEAVEAITRREDDGTYMDYIARCGANEIARAVKMADLRDNMNRCSGTHHRQLYKRYTRAREYLESLWWKEVERAP